MAWHVLKLWSYPLIYSTPLIISLYRTQCTRTQCFEHKTAKQAGKYAVNHSQNKIRSVSMHLVLNNVLTGAEWFQAINVNNYLLLKSSETLYISGTFLNYNVLILCYLFVQKLSLISKICGDFICIITWRIYEKRILLIFPKL